MTIFAVVACILGLMAWPVAALGSDLTDIVSKVRDGDTIIVGSIPVRLAGLHAPELSEVGGSAAKQAMLELVLGKRLRCDLTGERSHDRVIGTCYLEGRDIAAKLITMGLARDCRRYSNGRYAKLETTSGKRLKLPGYCLPR